MSIINRKPKTAGAGSPVDTTPDIEKFIDAAPDGAKGRKGIVKGKKLQISLTVESDILDQVDEMAGKQGLSRAAVINLAIRQILNKGATIGDDK